MATPTVAFYRILPGKSADEGRQILGGYRGTVVVGRENHYGSKSLSGTQVAALHYSLCESAKLVGVDPHAYLLTATQAALATPGAATLPDALLTAGTA